MRACLSMWFDVFRSEDEHLYYAKFFLKRALHHIINFQPVSNFSRPTSNEYTFLKTLIGNDVETYFVHSLITSQY